MPEEQLETQNTSEQTEEPAQSEGGEEQTPNAPEETPAPQEDKKSRDFEQGMHKWRERAKELETELNTFKSQPSSKTSLEDEDEDPKEALRNLIREEFAPLRDEIQADKRNIVVDRIGKMPYTADYADEIVAEAKTLPKEWAFEKRLELARASIIAKNLDTIVGTTKQAGINEAYDHQAVKGARPLGAAPAKSGNDAKTMLERYESGDMEPKEYLENQVEIDKQRKEKLGF